MLAEGCMVDALRLWSQPMSVMHSRTRVWYPISRGAWFVPAFPIWIQQACHVPVQAECGGIVIAPRNGMCVCVSSRLQPASKPSNIMHSDLKMHGA